MPAKTPAGDKKEIILKAVRTLIAQKGYAGTTVSLVAQEAGVSRGLLHYYFKNKEDMLVKVIQDVVELSLYLAEATFKKCSTANELADATILGLRHLVAHDPDFYPAFIQGVLVARQSRAVDKEIQNLFEGFRQSLETGFAGAIKRGIISPSISPYGLAAAVTGLIDGVGLQMVADPSLIDDEEIWEGVRKSALAMFTT
ncbi:MAG: TetR/AcrR family transcriptional regulator [Thermodesulfobacteriota bacterium]|nr:TetR/AcrR family transcriptional regulator [Thermodesulfobacteriota bacterium]